jgi:phosphoribosylaminoimidazole carboxylase (NCAIR synthetase)
MPRTRQPRRGAWNEFSVRNNSFRRPAPAATISFVSQFEQHIRAIAGWPLAKPIRRGRVEMTNLIGAEVEE